MQDYLLISSDKDDPGGFRLPAYKCVIDAISAEIWNLYHRTSYKNKITEGDRVFFYIAGQKVYAGHIIGHATVGNDTKDTGLHDQFGGEVSRSFHLIDPQLYDVPFNLRPRINELSIGSKAATAGNRWGSILMGGAKKLTELDAEIIMRT